MDFAAAVNEEVRDLFAAGADIVQIDEPWLQSRAEKAREFAVPAIDRALRRRRRARPRCTRASATRHVVHEGRARLSVPGRARRLRRRQSRDRGRPAAARPGGARAARATRPSSSACSTSATERGRDAPSRWRSGSRRRWPHAARAAAVGAGLRDEVPPPRRRVRQAAGAGRGRADRPRAALAAQLAAGRARHGAGVDELADARERVADDGKRSSVSARNGWKSSARKSPSRAAASSAASTVSRRRRRQRLRRAPRARRRSAAGSGRRRAAASGTGARRRRPRVDASPRASST